MRFPLWELEWRLALRRRRLFGLNTGVPLLLVVPLAVSDAPTFHAAAAYTVLFVLFGVFGSTIPILREGEGGLSRRILLAGAPESRILLERVAAASLIDFLQLLPALAVILLTGAASQGLWLLAPLVLLPSLLAANLLGVWVAAAARSLAEGALFAAVAALFLLHGSAVFRTPAPGSAGAWAEALLPFAPLHRILLAGAGGTPPPPAPLAELAQPLGAAGVLALLTAAAGPLLFARIAPPIPR